MKGMTRYWHAIPRPGARGRRRYANTRGIRRDLLRDKVKCSPMV